MDNNHPLSLHLDFKSGLPIYTQIMNQIQQQVSGGTLKPGDQLPTVRALASELRVNFNTVARAYRLLDEAGLISTQQGRGTYIMQKDPPEVEQKLRRETLRRFGPSVYWRSQTPELLRCRDRPNAARPDEVLERNTSRRK